MNPRSSKKNGKYTENNDPSGLSLGVMHLNGEPLDKERSVFWDFITQTFFFILGGVILCAMVYALVSFT